jgi:hypothetical protein
MKIPQRQKGFTSRKKYRSKVMSDTITKKYPNPNKVKGTRIFRRMKKQGKNPKPKSLTPIERLDKLGNYLESS